MSGFRLFTIAVPAALLPGVALAASGMTPANILIDAAPMMKVVMLALIVATLAAVAITIRKVLSGPRLTGGSAFLQALRLGGPLIGLLGAAYNVLMINIALANTEPQPSYSVLAPGVAEAAFLFVMGLTAGVVAVICNWIVEARIDRAVLRP